MNPTAEDGWIDANVILCHLTGQPPDMARAVGRLTARAQNRRLRLRVHPVTVAETVWVLSGAYRFPRSDISHVVRDLLRADCVDCEDRDAVLRALEDYATLNVDFVDAFLARKASASKAPICYTFDVRHFRRLGADAREPGDHA